MKDCEKLSQHTDEWNAIYPFIEWLQQNHMCIAVWRRKKDVEKCQEYLLEPYPYGQPIETLLYKYFGVNPEKLERERREILAQIRAWKLKEE